MDIGIILVGVAVFIISALMIYCISAFSMREKTFEEVMEEQRRRQEQEREKVKAEKKAEKEQQKKKYKKGKQDKVKEKAAQASEPSVKGEHKMVNLEIEPEIIEPTETLGLNAGLRQRSKKEKAPKPILHNKSEVTPVAEKTVGAVHKHNVPKDELELKKAHEVIEKVKVSHTEVQMKEPKLKHSADIKENLPPVKGDKGDKSKDVDQHSAKSKVSADDTQLNGSKLISSVKSAKLSDNEIQTLIDILLNRQGLTPTGPAATESWNKKSQKGDPVSTMKKQLEEKEKALAEEQNSVKATNARMKEMRNELMAEKSKYASLEKKSQDKAAQHQGELDALHKRMQNTHDQYLRETNELQARLRQLDQGGDKAASQKLSEENKILQETLSLKAKECVSFGEKVKSLEKELAKMQTGDASKKNLENKIRMYEEQIRKLEASQKDVDSMINKRVEEVSHELRKAEGKNQSLNSDLQKATSALSTAEGEVSTLKGKLQELEGHLKQFDASKDAEAKLQESSRKCSDLGGNVKNLEKQLADLSRRLSDKETESKQLQQENKTLKDENKVINERLQAAPAPNGDIHENGPSVPVTEHERILSEKNKELSDLTSGLESQKKTLSSLQAELDNKGAEIADLKEQLTKQKDKNNELREKNWKAMEALEISEKSSAEKVSKALKSAREMSSAGATEIEAQDKSVFQRLFPDVQISDKLPHKEWIVAFEKQATKKLPNKSDSDKLVKLKEENERLKGEVEVFKNNVGLMKSKEDRLKELEAENSRLQKQMAESKKEHQQLSSKLERLTQLETENKQLKSSQSATSSVDSEKYSQLEETNSRLKKEVENYSGIVADTENKLRQLEKSIDEEEKKWQEKLRKAQSQSQGGNQSSKRVQELETLLTEQENQMQMYRQVLSTTESKLEELEQKVTTEESSWQEKLKAAQSELTQTKGQLTNLRQELQQSTGSQEMHTKVEKLEEQLRESQERIILITKEKETLITQLAETKIQVSGVDVKNLEVQLSDLRTQLESERKKNKDLSLNIVKLNGIIKTGHDALTQEQGLVKQLQESLDSKSVHSGLSEHEEAEQLRIKLSEKQKLLEKEMSANKQLSERLAQLGMLASTSTDNGTSV